MSARGPCDERVGCVDGLPPLLKRGLVAARAYSRFAPGFQEAQALQERGRGLSLLWSDASLELGDVDAACSEPVPAGEELQQ